MPPGLASSWAEGLKKRRVPQGGLLLGPKISWKNSNGPFLNIGEERTHVIVLGKQDIFLLLLERKRNILLLLLERERENILLLFLLKEYIFVIMDGQKKIFIIVAKKWCWMENILILRRKSIFYCQRGNTY